MNDQTKISFTLRVVFAIAVLGLALTFMRVSADMLNALILAWIIVLVASPLLHWLRSKGVPTWLAFGLTLVAILAVSLTLIQFMIIAVNKFAEALPTYITEFENLVASVEDGLASQGINTTNINAFVDFIDPAKIMEAVADFLVGLLGTVSSFILVALLVVFLMLDSINVPAKLVEEIKAGNKYLKRLFQTSNTVRKYVFITTVVGLATGLLDTFWFILLGVDFAILWGILAFLLSYIPSLGFWLAAIPPTILALLESGPLTAALVFFGIVLINGFAENVVKPKYMGEGLNLSPFAVVFSVIFWAAILGPLGAILGVPMTLLFKELVLEADPQNQWIAKLMSSTRKPVQQKGEGEDTVKEME